MTVLLFSVNLFSQETPVAIVLNGEVMGRTRRYDEPGTFHHVTAKVAERWFATDPDRSIPECRLDGETACEMLIEAIKAAKKKFGFLLHAFVIMENHYHMVIGIPSRSRKGTISRILHAIHSPFAHRVNAVLERRGSVVLERTCTPVIRRVEYLANALNYVHCNPGRCSAGIDPREYKYSSLRTILTSGRGGWNRELVDLAPSAIGLPRYRHLTARWTVRTVTRLLEEWLGGEHRSFSDSICSIAVGTAVDRLEIDLALGQKPVRRGRWAVGAIPDRPR